jgi:hypothetical protein
MNAFAMRRYVIASALCILTSTLAAQPVPDPVYDVDIVFMGLMTFQLGAKSATIVIPNVNAGRNGIGDPPVHDIDKHKAYVLANVANIDSSNTFMTGSPSVTHGETTFRFVQLNGEQISLDDGNDVWDPGLNSPLDYWTNDDGQPCPTAATQTSMHWLSSLSKVVGTMQTPDAKHFVHRPSVNDVIGRLNLYYGSLAAHVLKGSHIHDFHIVNQPGPGNVSQAFAQEIHWTFKARSIPFGLNLLSFDGTSARHLAFKPDANNSLVLVVGNTMQDDIGALPSNLTLPPTDPHYSIYYEFVSGNSALKGPIPHLAQKCADQTVLFDRTLKLASAPPVPPAPPLPQPHGSARSSPPPPLILPAPGGLNCGPDNWP